MDRMVNRELYPLTQLVFATTTTTTTTTYSFKLTLLQFLGQIRFKTLFKHTFCVFHQIASRPHDIVHARHLNI